MPTWLVRVAIGCATTIMSFVAMVLLFMLTLYLKCGACEPDYNSSASDYILLAPAAPLFLLVGIILGAVVGYRIKLSPRGQSSKQVTAKIKAGH